MLILGLKYAQIYNLGPQLLFCSITSCFNSIQLRWKSYVIKVKGYTIRIKSYVIIFIALS